MIPKQAKQAVGQRLLSRFRDAGATEIAPDILLPAGDLLDLYGEDIRARAYVTPDPIRGEMMLRPDFTVPVVQAHMQNGADPARYCYLGEVFRKQDTGDTRPATPRDHEYLQCGFELFTRDPQADARCSPCSTTRWHPMACRRAWATWDCCWTPCGACR